MHMQFRTCQAVLPMLVSCTLLKFACQAALLPSALLCAVFSCQFFLLYVNVISSCK
jgi:hypothetical protein